MKSDLNLIVKGAAFMAVGIFASKILGYVYQIFLARILTPGEFGLFLIATAVLGFFTMLANFGVADSLPRFIAFYQTKKEDGKVKGSIFAAIKIHLFTSVFLAAVFFFSADWLAVAFFSKPEIAVLLRVLALSLPISLIATDYMASLEGFKRIEYKILARKIIEIISKILVLFLFFLMGLSLWGAVFSFIISEAVVLFFGIFVLHKKVFPAHYKTIKKAGMNKEILAFAWPLLLTGIFANILVMIDTIMLGFFAPSYDTGLYGTAVPIGKLVLMPFDIIIVLGVPITATYFALNQMDSLKKIFRTVSRWIFVFSLPLALLLALFAEPVQVFLFGEAYRNSATAMSILAIGYLLFSAFGPSHQVLIASGRTRLNFLNATAAGIIAVGLNLLFIPYFLQMGMAVVGAALSTMIAYFIWGAIGFIEMKMIFKLNTFTRQHVKTAVAAVLPICAAFFAVHEFLPYSIFSAIATGAIALAFYCLLLLALKCFEKEDIEVLLAIEKKAGFRIEFLHRIMRRFI